MRARALAAPLLATLICHTNAGSCVIDVVDQVTSGPAVLLCDGSVVDEQTIGYPTVCDMRSVDVSAIQALRLLQRAVGLRAGCNATAE